MSSQHPMPKCRCGQPFVLVVGSQPGDLGRYCPHCDKPHDSWTANEHCVACQLYAQNTTRT